MQAKAEHFQLGDVKLQSGEVLRAADLAYVTCGSLNAARDSAILFPTYYTGTHREKSPWFL